MKLSQKFMKNRGKEGTRKERTVGGAEMSEGQVEEKNELADMRRQKER